MSQRTMQLFDVYYCISVYFSFLLAVVVTVAPSHALAAAAAAALRTAAAQQPTRACVQFLPPPVLFTLVQWRTIYAQFMCSRRLD